MYNVTTYKSLLQACHCYIQIIITSMSPLRINHYYASILSLHINHYYEYVITTYINPHYKCIITTYKSLIQK